MQSLNKLIEELRKRLQQAERERDQAMAKNSVYGEKQTDVIDMVMKVKTMQAEVCVHVCIMYGCMYGGQA
jgi:hypothetical protein